jgi:hypothetical protein
MNFLKEDIWERMSGKRHYFVYGAMPLTLDNKVKILYNHYDGVIAPDYSSNWCAISSMYVYEGIDYFEPHWNVYLPKRKDRRDFAYLLEEICQENDIMYVRPNWKKLFETCKE